MGRKPTASKANTIPDPGELEKDICTSIHRILYRLGGNKDHNQVEAEAAYYTAYILLTPTDINKIISDGGVREYAKKLIRRGNFNEFKKAKENLLEDGLIAQIVPTLDFRDAKGFGKVPFLPIDPKTFFELNKHKLTDLQLDTIEVIKNRTTHLSEEFNKKFSIESLRERCGKSKEAKHKSGTSEPEIADITIYYSGMWVTYTLAANLQENKDNIIFMMINGSRVSGSPQLAYYKKNIK